MKTVDAMLCTFALVIVITIGGTVASLFKAAVDVSFPAAREARAD